MDKLFSELNAQYERGEITFDELIDQYKVGLVKKDSFSELVNGHSFKTQRSGFAEIINSYSLYLVLSICVLIFIVVFKIIIKSLVRNARNFSGKIETDIYIAYAITSFFSLGFSCFSFVLMYAPFSWGRRDARLLFVATILGAICVLVGFVWHSLILGIKRGRAIAKTDNSDRNSVSYDDIKENNLGLGNIGQIFKDHPKDS